MRREYIMSECRRQWEDNQELEWGAWETQTEEVRNSYYNSMEQHLQETQGTLGIDSIMEYVAEEDLRVDGDTTSFKIETELGLFIAVEDMQDYQDKYLVTFIELNYVDQDSTYEPIDAITVVGTDLGEIQRGIEELLKRN